MIESDLVLRADGEHPGLVQIGKLCVRRPLPESDENIYPGIAIGRGVGWGLQPDCDGEKRGIGSCGLPRIEG